MKAFGSPLFGSCNKYYGYRSTNRGIWTESPLRKATFVQSTEIFPTAECYSCCWNMLYTPNRPLPRNFDEEKPCGSRLVKTGDAERKTAQPSASLRAPCVCDIYFYNVLFFIVLWGYGAPEVQLVWYQRPSWRNSGGSNPGRILQWIRFFGCINSIFPSRKSAVTRAWVNKKIRIQAASCEGEENWR